MPIPKDISPEHVKQAIEQLDHGVEHPFGPSVDYDLVFEGRRYPPKAVVALAAALATGASLAPKDFSGGEGSGQANTVLRNLGFDIERKPERRDSAACVAGDDAKQSRARRTGLGVWNLSLESVQEPSRP